MSTESMMQAGGTRLKLMIGTALCVSFAAEAASPIIENILPRGAQRGTSVEITFHGQRLEDAADLLFHQQGITFEQIVSAESNAVVCAIAIAPDAPLGRHAIRLRTNSGLTNPFIFVVGAYPETREAEPNSSAGEAQSATLNTTINGVIANEDVDYFAVDLQAGTRIAVEVEGIRLGHKLFDPKLRFFGPGGHELVSEDDTPLMRQDPTFSYVVKETGTYHVAVSEATYGGSNDFEYRLHIGTFPRPLALSPLGGAPNTPITTRLLGDTSDQSVDVIPASFSAGTARVEISTDQGIAPTPLPFKPSFVPTVAETEPSAENPPLVPIPGAIEGIIQQNGDADWFAFDGIKDQAINVQVIAREVGSPLDSVVEILGPDGAQVLYSDDANTPDSSGRLTLPADGRYKAYIRDHLNHGGPTFAYRVEMTPIVPSLWFTPVDNEPCAVIVPKNNHAFLLLSLNRRDFDGQVDLTFKNLPEGVTAHHDPIHAGATRVPVVFQATSEAAPAATLIATTGTWQNDDHTTTGELSHTIRLVLGRNDTVFDALHIDRIAMAVAEEAPFTLELIPPKSPVPKNGFCNITVRATRAEGFTAPIEIRAPHLPASIGLPSATIAEDQSETQLRLEVYQDATTGPANLVLVGESAGYNIATPFTPITVEDPWVIIEMPESQGEQGATVTWPIKMTVNRPFEEEIVLNPVGLPNGVTAEPLQVAAATADVDFSLNLAPDAPEGKQGPIGFNTTVTVNDQPVTLRLGGAEMKIFKPLPPQLAAPAPEPEPEKEPEEAPVRRTRFPTEM